MKELLGKKKARMQEKEPKGGDHPDKIGVRWG